MTYTYDATGRLLGVRDGALGQAVHYTYDNRGLRTGMQAAGHTVRYRYDDAMRLTAVKQDSDAAAVYRYDDGGRRVSLTLPNGVRTRYRYDGSDRLTGMATKDAAGVPLAGFRYALDAVGNRVRQVKNGVETVSRRPLPPPFQSTRPLLSRTRLLTRPPRVWTMETVVSPILPGEDPSCPTWAKTRSDS